jgi:vacuolar-type H+-ATPase subunit E/Vma4
MDDEFRRQLEGEDEIDEIFDKQEAKFLKQIEEAQKAIISMVKLLKEKGTFISEIAKAVGKTEDEVKAIISQ